MKKNYFVGIDVSKQTIDVAFVMQTDQHRTPSCWKIFSNNDHGFHQMKLWLQANQVPLTGDTYLL